MKKWMIILYLLIPVTACLQDSLLWPKTGKNCEELLPDNWRVLDSISGDINRDGYNDFVFAVQNTDTTNFDILKEYDSDTIDLNPRVLGVYFGSTNGTYHQQLIKTDFIILRESPVMDEPFDGFEIDSNGVLSIQFHFWMSMGSYRMSSHRYVFRFENEVFRLIRYEANEAHRASGETTDYRINFITNELEIYKGNFSNDEPESLKKKDIQLEKWITLNQMKRPFEYEIEGVNF